MTHIYKIKEGMEIMNVTEFVREVLKISGADGYLEVKLDDEIPSDFFDHFSMEKGKGFFLIKPVKSCSSKKTSSIKPLTIKESTHEQK